MIGKELKERFKMDVLDKQGVGPKVLVVAVLLPSGAIEIITNTECLDDKMNYYLEKYNDKFQLITNPMIRIVGYMLV